MRIVLHSGLHKSATTLTQTAWGQAWSEPGATWFPRRARTSPGHSYLFRPYLRAFTERADPDLVLVSLTSNARRDDLPAAVAEAVAHGVGTLVLSSEDLSRIQPDEVPDVLAALGGHDLTHLLTATRPVHRWCSNWQTMVRRGLDQEPQGIARFIERIAALTAGRLETLTRAWPATRTIVRLVETEPAEPDLPRDLARTVGLPDLAVGPPTGGRNVSLGADVEVLRRLNAADEALGTGGGGSERLAELRGEGFTYRDREAAVGFEISETAWVAAHAEHAFLAGLATDPAIELHDPRGLLERWLDPAVPTWYDAVSRREAVLPDLGPAPGLADQLWRARQERAAYQALLQRSEEQVRDLRRRLRRRNARIEELEGPSS